MASVVRSVNNNKATVCHSWRLNSLGIATVCHSWQLNSLGIATVCHSWRLNSLGIANAMHNIGHELEQIK